MISTLNFDNNSDTQVKPGWLDEQLIIFTNSPSCGLTSSKSVYPDRRLQEVGGIIWQDGSAWNYDRYQDPALQRYNYAREMDYIPGAAIMVSAKLFRELGGFDYMYAPAYYEDTDLAMRIRAHGLRLIYQPLSEVVHYEDVTSGTDNSCGVKSSQHVNGEKFLKEWQHALTKRRPNGVEPYLERVPNAVGRVLFIDACTSTPNHDSGTVDITT
jgi:GT2 family glycosyltransferase